MASVGNGNFFDVPKVSRMISLGMPVNDILPHFKPLIRNIISTNKVVWDHRNHTEDDLMQIGLIKCMEIIEKFSCLQGDLFAYSLKVILRALWSEARLKPLDRLRVTVNEGDGEEEVDFETKFGNVAHPGYATMEESVEFTLDPKIAAQFRVESDDYSRAAGYVFGVLTSNDYESNRARVIKTLTHGFDVNPKHARFLADHVLVTLRRNFSKGASEIRDDDMFDNTFKYTLVPELRELLGERAFERLIHFFGGITISIPSADNINHIDRDLAILRALAADWNCGPSLSKKYGISPEGIKAVYKACLHRLHTDAQYRDLVSQMVDLNSIPGFESASNNSVLKKVKKSQVTFGERKAPPKRKMTNTDSMGFTLGCRNSLLYTLIITGKCTRVNLVEHVLAKFGGTESAAKATVSAFLSDIKHPFGKFNTSRNLKLLTDSGGRLSFERNSLNDAQKVVAAKRQTQMIAMTA
jgi:hypothetical protein